MQSDGKGHWETLPHRTIKKVDRFSKVAAFVPAVLILLGFAVGIGLAEYKDRNRQELKELREEVKTLRADNDRHLSLQDDSAAE